VIGASAVSPETAVRGVGVAAGAIGLAVCGLVRDWGRKREPALWESWGGNPAARRLRWRDAADDEAVRRLHDRLDSVLDAPLPGRSAEMQDPEAADRCYEEAVASLRDLTRDTTRFRLVFAENVEYGFRRNSLGLRKIALAVAVLAFALSVAMLAVHGGEGQWVQWGISVAISLAASVYWWRVVNPLWVRAAAEVYADRLLEAANTLRASVPG